MSSTRTSLRFVVGTALLTGGIATAGGCSKPNIDTRPDTPPEQPPAVDAQPAAPEQPPPEDPPLVDIRPEDVPPTAPEEEPPRVNLIGDPPEPITHTVNIRPLDPPERPENRPHVDTVAPPPPPPPPRVNLRPTH